MSKRCSRSWEIEAARDGRLRGSALDAHRQHVSSCPVCLSEKVALNAIVERCKAGDDGPVDQIAMRRMRREVLKRTDSMLASGAAPLSIHRLLALASALAAIGMVVAIAMSRGWGRHPPSPRVDVEITAGTSGQWQRSSSPGLETFRLVNGVLALRVRREPGSRRVLVEVPDGEIEDIGTVFRVEVAKSRTERVAVEEGMVHIRLLDGTNITLRSGERWDRSAGMSSAAPELPLSPPASTGSVPSAVVAERAASSAPDQGFRKPANTTAASAPTSASSSHTEPATTGIPNQDLAYVSVLSLLRSGQRREASRAAQDYLRRFPDGFRRKEMSRVAEGLEP